MEVLIIVMLLIVMDITSGIVAAIQYKQFKSEELRRGLYHKFAVLMLLALAYILQYAAGQVPNLPAELQAIYPGTGLYIILMEASSLLENIVKINPALANNKIMRVFDSKVPGEGGENV